MTQQPQNSFEAITNDLHNRYGETFSREEVAAAVTEARAELERTATITEYLPLFVRRFAKERLQTMARQEGRVAREVKQVLFVCRGNAGRSQMAAAFAEHFGQGHVRCLSAGTDPLAEVLPQVRQVMIEKGIELPEAFPKPVTAAATETADVIVTMGVAEDALPARGKQQISWDIAPVVGESLEVTRATRDDIEQRTRDLVKELLGS